MRLKPEEVETIATVLEFFLRKSDSKVFLYGSRTQDHLKGGDIDLLIQSSDPEQVSTLKENKLKILVALKKGLGDRRIDLTLASSSECEDPFVKEIMKTAVLLRVYSK